MSSGLLSSGLMSACCALLLEGVLGSFLAHWVLCYGCLQEWAEAFFFFIEAATPLYPGVMHKALYVQVCGMGPHHLKFLSVLSGLEWRGSAHHLGIIVPLL